MFVEILKTLRGDNGEGWAFYTLHSRKNLILIISFAYALINNDNYNSCGVYRLSPFENVGCSLSFPVGSVMNANQQSRLGLVSA